MPDYFQPSFSPEGLAKQLGNLATAPGDRRTPQEKQADDEYSTAAGKAAQARKEWKRAQNRGAHPRELQRARNVYFRLARLALDAEEYAGRLKDHLDAE